MERRQNKTKFSTRIIFAMLLVSLLSGLLVGIISVRYMHNFLTTESRHHIKSMAQIAASNLDGDMLEGIQYDDMWNADYQYIYYQLRNFLTDQDVEFIYTMRQVGDHAEFIVDGDVDEPCLVGETYPIYDKMQHAFDGMLSLDDKVTSDQWGKYYSAFAPIRNSQGRVVAIVGIDSTVKSIHERVQKMAKSLVLVEGICILACTVLSVVAAKRMSQFVEEASKDGLTGMYNRRYAVRYIDKTSLEDISFGFLLLDIDYFKQVNDTYGHRVGDSVLVGLANIIQRLIGRDDIGFRLGGDEFSVFFARPISQQEIKDLAAKAQEEFARVVDMYCPKLKNVGLSFGGVVGKGYVPFGDLYHNADKLLYEVKNNGKGQCRTMELNGNNQKN